MSGGVDSSVAAALLARQGFEVIGITMCFGTSLKDAGGKRPACCGLDAIDDAKKVAAKLGIKHYVLNFGRQFSEKVINDFIQSYLKGETPNPCIRCNQFIKFGALFKKAKELGAYYLATGHYAQIGFDNKKYFIKKGKDSRYDQSYFLYLLKQGELKHFLFPLGKLTKNQARNIADELRLPVAKKPSSQEICFISDDYRSFLRRRARKFKAGPIRLSDGKSVGEHKGIGFYTVGQRDKLGVALGRPQYVNKIDAKNNTIFIGDRNECLFGGCEVEKVNFFEKCAPFSSVDTQVKIRYNHRQARCQVKIKGSGRAQILFRKPQFAVTPGQSAVVYRGNKVLLGGKISKGIR